jgi:putative endonuclease
MGGEEKRDGTGVRAYAVGHMKSTLLRPVGAARGWLWRSWLEAQRRALAGIDRLAGRLRGEAGGADARHLETGMRGEEVAMFELRRQGYTIVARRWTSPKARGDVDLIGWQGEWLCFIEVKTRTGRDRVPAEFAVDAAKQETLRRLARAYLKGLPEERRRRIRVRFDVVAVYLMPGGGGRGAKVGAEVEVFAGVFPRNPALERSWAGGRFGG